MSVFVCGSVRVCSSCWFVVRLVPGGALVAPESLLEVEHKKMPETSHVYVSSHSGHPSLSFSHVVWTSDRLSNVVGSASLIFSVNSFVLDPAKSEDLESRRPSNTIGNFSVPSILVNVLTVVGVESLLPFDL